MRKLFVLMATAFLALGTAGVANTAVLNWEGTARVSLADYPEGVLTGGGVATINGSSGVIPAHLNTLRLAASRGQFEGTFTRIVTDPDVLGSGVALLVYEGIEGQTGTWGGISGGAASTSTGGGILPVGGTVKYCILSTACTQFLPILLTQPTTVNGVPGTGIKGIGIGGLLTVGGYGGIRMSMQQAPWTVKTATVIDQITTVEGSRISFNLVYKGWAHDAASTTSSTAKPGGMVQLVAPQQVETNLPLGSNDKVGTGAMFVIHFIPEPGLLLLVGSGIAGLAVLGRARMRK